MKSVSTRRITAIIVVVFCLWLSPKGRAAAAAEPSDNALQTLQTAQKTPDKTIQASEEIRPPSINITLDECIKCHYRIVRLIDKRGMAHRDKVSCVDCHHGHPPADSNVIPECSRCHNGHRHFALPNCLTCHNPHRPLDIELPNRITEPCLTCHEFQGEQLTNFPSIHTRLGCTACHKQHGKIPSCYRCHASHIEGVTDDEGPCKKCHLAHMPLVVTYGAETEIEVCAGCHNKVASILRESKTKHSGFLCSKCHPPPHKTIPACRDCHGTPHSEFILQKFGSCGECHDTAHKLTI